MQSKVRITTGVLLLLLLLHFCEFHFRWQLWSPCRCVRPAKVTQFLFTFLHSFSLRFVSCSPLLICLLLSISIAILRGRLTYLARVLFLLTVEWMKKRESSTCRCLTWLKGLKEENEKKRENDTDFPLFLFLPPLLSPWKGFFQTISNRPVPFCCDFVSHQSIVSTFFVAFLQTVYFFVQPSKFWLVRTIEHHHRFLV